MTAPIPCPDARARLLARAIGGRFVRGRLFLPGRKLTQYQALYDAGFHAVRRGSRLMFRRDPVAVDLYRALEISRLTGDLPLDCKEGAGENAKAQP